MKRNRFTPTTAILIVVLVGALYAVGKQVNPPPAAPPAPPPIAKAAPAGSESSKGGQPRMMDTSAIQKKMKEEAAMQEKQKMKDKLTLELNHGKPLPSDIGVSSEYFRTYQMGNSGLKKADADAENAKKVQEQVDKKLKAMSPHDNGSPASFGESGVSAKDLLPPLPPK